MSYPCKKDTPDMFYVPDECSGSDCKSLDQAPPYIWLKVRVDFHPKPVVAQMRWWELTSLAIKVWLVSWTFKLSVVATLICIWVSHLL